MIDKKEIENKSKEFEINPSNVERDYVFGWFLFGIFTASNLKDEIFLKGGNALRKGYFENTRYSYDLDFGIPEDIDQDILLKEINNICDFVTEKSGIVFKKDENRLDEKFTAANAPIPDLRVYEARVYFEDFYGKKEIRIKISMDVTRFDKTILPVQNVKLIHPYSDFKDLDCHIRCMKMEEIIATKLKCLLQRQHVPDLFDYAHSIKMLGGSLNKEEVVEALIEKTIFRDNPCVLKNILRETPFSYFRKIWAKTLICAKQFVFDVEDGIKIFTEDLENIFSKYPDNGYVDFAYFGPKFRVPIMEAGRSQTLLKIRYKGEDRIVEPYSLKYMQRKDGTEREYFYGYKIEGGSSPQGVRMFVAENMESIENMNEKFKPRFTIEVCKSGEKPENPYLFDPDKPTKEPRRSRSVFSPRTVRFPSGPRYIYQCSYCGKKFTKKYQNSTLGKHKDTNGYPCSSRSGYYIDTKY